MSQQNLLGTELVVVVIDGLVIKMHGNRLVVLKAFGDVEISIACDIQQFFNPAGVTGYEGRTRTYALQQCADLIGNVWSDVTGYDAIAGDGSPQNCTVPMTVSSQCYRVLASVQ